MVAAAAVLLFVALFCCAAGAAHASGTVTVTFTLTMPNSTYPLLGEHWQGTLTYNTTLNPFAYEDYPLGHALVGITGTRTVYTSTPSNPTSYQLNSTANIAGLLPTQNCFITYNTTLALGPGVQPLACVTEADFDTSPDAVVYSSWFVSGVYNLTNYTDAVAPDGLALFPFINIAYDNLYYDPQSSGILNALDYSGWAVVLDRDQPGTYNASMDPRFPNSDSVVVLNSFGATIEEGATIADQDGTWALPNNGYEQLPFGYEGAIVLTPLTSSVLGDPSFVGLRGQRYQVHGMDGEVYNLISSPTMQLNARFTFLRAGQCPILDGVADTGCWSHPGSYLGAIALQVRVAEQLHVLVIQSGDHKQGFASVQLDGTHVAVSELSEATSDETFEVRRTSAHRLEVTTAMFIFVFSNSDGFINQEVQIRVPLSCLNGTHGLLGQTHTSDTYPTALRYIVGDVDDYLVADRDLLGTNFLYNRLH